MAKFVDTDDELSEVPTSKSSEDTSTKDTKPTTRKPTANLDDEDESPAARAVADDDLDCDFGDEKLMKYDGLDRITLVKTDKGRKRRFAILPFVKPKKANTHYVEKEGTFRCLTTDPADPRICCQGKLDDSSLRIIALSIEYTNVDNKTGKYVKKNGDMPAIEWRLGYVQLSKTNYRQISGLPEDDQSVYDIDIVMSLKENGIGFEFNKVASKALWKRIPELAQEVEDACKPFLDGKQLAKLLGKKITAIEYKALIAKIAGGAEGASMQDLEDL